MATVSKTVPYEHIHILMIRAAQMLETENIQAALGFLQKATDEVMQLEAINKQVRMIGGGRPYRNAAEEKGVEAV